MTTKELELAKLAQILNNPWYMAIFAVIGIWTIIWKGIALWKAARNGSNIWFVILLLINSVGILEIIYIFYFSKKNQVQ